MLLTFIALGALSVVAVLLFARLQARTTAGNGENAPSRPKSSDGGGQTEESIRISSALLSLRNESARRGSEAAAGLLADLNIWSAPADDASSPPAAATNNGYAKGRPSIRGVSRQTTQKLAKISPKRAPKRIHT